MFLRRFRDLISVDIDPTRVQSSIAVVVLILVIGYVIYDQAYDVGFRKGHRGWVSSHTLAVIQKASPANGFLGYAIGIEEADGSRSYSYFDRYPIFFSAAVRIILNTVDLTRAQQVYLARQVMNLIYGLILLAAVALLIELQILPGVAVAAAALAGAGHYLVEYRDLIHYDQPALLGFMILLWAIARYKRANNRRVVYVATILAVTMGRGYASFAILGVWWICETIAAVFADWRKSPRVIATSVQTRACIISIAIASSCLGYNMLMEANTRDVSITEVGIFESALRRLSIDKKFKQKRRLILKWDSFTRREAVRGIEGLQPWMFRDAFQKSGKRVYWGVGAVAIVVGIFAASRRRRYRIPIIVMSLSGIAWLFPMRGLTAFHDYTTIYFFSLNLTFFAAILSFVTRRTQLIPAVLTCVFLLASNQMRNEDLEKESRKSNVLTEELGRIARKLKPGDRIMVEPSHKRLIKGAPYAVGFYFPDQKIQTEKPATLFVTGDEEHEGTNLTPKNHRIFLFKTSGRN